MTPQEFASLLDKTLEDSRLSRNERRTLTDLTAQVGADEQKLGQFRKLAFEKAAAAIGHPNAGLILEWLDEVLKALQTKGTAASSTPGGAGIAEAHFSPGDECLRRLISLIGSAKSTLDICVFTITDDRISGAILSAHRRGVKVRIITDDEKSMDLGSDIEELRKAGIPVRMDRSTFHMHHKFAVVDGSALLNGSFNWTRSASKNNQENYIISGDPKLIAAFLKEFEKLWAQFAN